MMCLLKVFFITLFSLLSVAFITLLERKILSIIGLRFGPNKVSIYGSFQPLIDALKISQKQSNLLSNFSFLFYYISSMIMISMSILMWVMLGINFCFENWKISIIIFLLFLSIHTINLIFSGWAAFSKYSVISILRSISQMVSYEIIIYISMFFILYFYSSFYFFYSLSNVSMFIIFPFLFFLFFFSVLAELSRTPMDFSESESELVSGFNIDYGSKLFSIIFMSEYSNLLFFSFMIPLIFIFYSNLVLLVMFLMFFITIIWIRSMFPRIRYDLFMSMSWKILMPFLTFYFILLIYFL